MWIALFISYIVDGMPTSSIHLAYSDAALDGGIGKHEARRDGSLGQP